MPESYQNYAGSVAMFENSMNNLTQTINAYNKMNWDSENARDMRAYYEKMAEKQNEWNLNMWNKTNEYNSPSAQIQRLRDAGLNPLYYGLDGSSANALESAQPLGYERASAGVFGNPMYQSGVEAMLKAQNIAAQTKLTEAQAKKEEIGNQYLPEQYRATIDQMYANTEKVKTSTLYEQILIDNGYPKGLAENVWKDIDVKDSEITKNEAQTDLAKAQEAWTNFQKERGEKMLDYEIKQIESAIRANNANAALNSARALIEGYRAKYIQENGVDLPNGALVSLLSYVQNFLGDSGKPSSNPLLDFEHNPIVWAFTTAWKSIFSPNYSNSR